jgi:hypothetical protein
MQMLPSHYPRTAEWLSNPENAKIAHDDIKELSTIETVISKFRNGAGSLAAVPWSTSQGLWSAPRVVGDLLQTLTKPLSEITGLPDVGGKLAQYSTEQQKGAGETAKYLRGKREGAGLVETGIYSGIESLGQNLLMMPATLLSGSATPMLLGMSASQGGQSYGEARDSGHSVLASSLFGASQGAIEYATEMIPALRFVDAMKGKTTLAKALKNVLGPDVLGEQVATLSQDLNEWAVTNPDKPFSSYLEERPSAAAQTFIATIIGTGGMVATAKGLEKIGSSVEKYQAAKEESDFLIALGDSVKASKVFARLPSALQEIVKQIKQDGSVQDIYVPVDKFTELFQSQGMDPRQAAEQILSDPKRFYEAQATGGDVAIPLEEFARLADAPFYGELAKDARTSLTGMTAREAEAFGQDHEKTVNDLLQTISETVPPVEDAKYQDAYQRIYDDTYGQLIGVNQNPSEAQANATLRAKGLATLAQRYGYDADTLMAQFPISVTRGELPAALQRQPSFTEQQQTAKLAEMLDTLRSGKQVKESEMFGPSLGELLREKGVKDDRGDLSAMDVDKGLKFKKKMLRENGLSLDKARQLAVDQKYLPEGATTEDLLDALANEMRGQAKYSPEFTNHVLIDQKQIHDELAQWLDMMGVDLAQTDNSKIMEMMQQSVDRFADAGKVMNQSFQSKKDVKRGYIKFGDNVPGFEIALLKDADASTFIHELGHYYHEVLGRLATHENAPETLKRDYQTILSWLGATDKQSLTVEQSEKFARGFEAYLYEGNAPSQELRGVFQRFKTWLKAVYSSLKSLNVELSDDVRGVFDRLLATDDEIKAAEGEQNVKSIFATAEEAGMSQSVFDAYRKLAEQAHEDAKDRLERAKLKEVKRTHQAWWKEARAKMAEEVEAEAKQEPVYEVLNFLYTGKLFDGSTFEGQSFKFSGSELVKMYDAATVKGMRKRLGDVYRNEGGISPHVVAEMFGFSSVDEMIKKMMEVPKLKEYVKQETERRMNEQYGTMNTAEIADEAINAVHNEEQAKLLREELKAIRRKVKEVKPFVQAGVNAAVDREKAEREYERRWMEAERKLAVAIERGAKQAEIDDLKESIRADKDRARAAKKMAAESIPPIEFFKEAARRHIAGLKVSEILPGKFGRAEAKAGKEAFELNGKGQFAEASQAKQRQLLNHFLYREATEARAEADKISSYMRGLEAGKVQQRIGKAGQDYLDQVNALLDKYEFRRKTGAELDARESLLDCMDRYEKAHGYAPPVAPSVMEEAKQVNYRSLTFGELVDVKDTVEAIVHLARTEGKLLQDELKRDIIEVAEEGAASIDLNSKGRKPRKPEKTLPQDLPGKYMENYFASHRKMSSLARQMDGGQDGGAIWNMLIRPMNVAGDREAMMRAEAATKLNEIFRVYSGLERTKMHRREFIPEINNSISKWGRIMVALNMGNEGNRQRLASMYSTTEVEAIVSTLDQRDWQFVENIWGMLESYWPEIEAKEKRVNGVAPKKVETMPVVTKFGTIQGGYFPIKYDREETAKTGGQEEAEVYKQMMGGAFTKATTRHGHTEARLEAVNRPLSLSIDTIFQHFNQVIHDLTHHEMLVDVNRLLGTTELQEAIRDNYGMEAYRVFTDGVRDVAVGDIPAQEAFEKFMAYTRVGISTAGLGYNLITSMMQPLGLTQSIVRIGPQWVGKGIGRWIGSPKRMIETADWIYSQSDFMKTRAMTQNREIAEIQNQMTVGVIPNSVRDSFFYLIQQCQKVVDIPTWLGQYEKSMAEHGNEADAVAEADQAVIDSQASGQMKDLARIQRGGPMKKMFTTFYSFFSTTYNLAAESAGRTHFKNPAEVGRFMVDMLMLYTVPVVLTVALKESIQRAIGGGDPDDEKLLLKLAGEQLGYLSGGFIGFRELGSMFSGFQGYEGPAGARVYSSIIKFFKQVGQGEIDEALIKAGNGLGGILFHYPATQVQRTVEGMKELSDGRGNLLSLLFGKPKKN